MNHCIPERCTPFEKLAVNAVNVFNFSVKSAFFNCCVCGFRYFQSQSWMVIQRTTVCSTSASLTARGMMHYECFQHKAQESFSIWGRSSAETNSGVAEKTFLIVTRLLIPEGFSCEKRVAALTGNATYPDVLFLLLFDAQLQNQTLPTPHPLINSCIFLLMYEPPH